MPEASIESVALGAFRVAGPLSKSVPLVLAEFLFQEAPPLLTRFNLKILFRKFTSLGPDVPVWTIIPPLLT